MNDKYADQTEKDRIVNLVRNAIDSTQEIINNEAEPENLQFMSASLDKELFHIHSWDGARYSLIPNLVLELTEEIKKTMNWVKDREESRRARLKSVPEKPEHLLNGRSFSECVSSEFIADESIIGQFEEMESDEDSEYDFESDDDCEILDGIGEEPDSVRENPDGENTTEERKKSSKPHKCELCGMKFKWLCKLQTHKQVHLAKDDPRRKRIQCGTCTKTFSQKSNLRAHEKIHKASNDPNKIFFECDSCYKVFGQKKNLKKHKKFYCKNIEILRSYECDICGKPFVQPSDVERHKKTHLAFDDHRRKRFKCETCLKFFVRKKDLQIHEKLHLADIEKRLPFKCGDCDKRFARQTHLQGHTKTHSDLAPLDCKICLKVFARKAELTKHRRNTHKIMFDESLTTSSSSNESDRKEDQSMVSKHYNDEDFVRKILPIKCSLCTYRCKLVGQLNRHKKTHLNPGPFKCGICARVFLTKVGLSVHKNITHNTINYKTIDSDSTQSNQEEDLMDKKSMNDAPSEDEESENESEDDDDNRPSTSK